MDIQELSRLMTGLAYFGIMGFAIGLFPRMRFTVYKVGILAGGIIAGIWAVFYMALVAASPLSAEDLEWYAVLSRTIHIPQISALAVMFFALNTQNKIREED